jgi:hypothetical protein
MTALKGRETCPLLEGFATLNSLTNDIASSTKQTCPLLEENMVNFYIIVVQYSLLLFLSEAKDKLILFKILVRQNMEDSTLHNCDLPSR